MRTRRQPSSVCLSAGQIARIRRVAVPLTKVWMKQRKSELLAEQMGEPVELNAHLPQQPKQQQHHQPANERPASVLSSRSSVLSGSRRTVVDDGEVGVEDDGSSLVLALAAIPALRVALHKELTSHLNANTSPSAQGDEEHCGDDGEGSDLIAIGSRSSKSASGRNSQLSNKTGESTMGDGTEAEEQNGVVVMDPQPPTRRRSSSASSATASLHGSSQFHSRSSGYHMTRTGSSHRRRSSGSSSSQRRAMTAAQLQEEEDILLDAEDAKEIRASMSDAESAEVLQQTDELIDVLLTQLSYFEVKEHTEKHFGVTFASENSNGTPLREHGKRKQEEKRPALALVDVTSWLQCIDVRKHRSPAVHDIVRRRLCLRFSRARLEKAASWVQHIAFEHETYVRWIPLFRQRCADEGLAGSIVDELEFFFTIILSPRVFKTDCFLPLVELSKLPGLNMNDSVLVDINRLLRITTSAQCTILGAFLGAYVDIVKDREKDERISFDKAQSRLGIRPQDDATREVDAVSHAFGVYSDDVHSIHLLADHLFPDALPDVRIEIARLLSHAFLVVPLQAQPVRLAQVLFSARLQRIVQCIDILVGPSMAQIGEIKLPSALELATKVSARRPSSGITRSATEISSIAALQSVSSATALKRSSLGGSQVNTPRSLLEATSSVLESPSFRGVEAAMVHAATAVGPSERFADSSTMVLRSATLLSNVLCAPLHAALVQALDAHLQRERDVNEGLSLPEPLSTTPTPAVVLIPAKPQSVEPLTPRPPSASLRAPGSSPSSVRKVDSSPVPSTATPQKMQESSSAQVQEEAAPIAEVVHDIVRQAFPDAPLHFVRTVRYMILLGSSAAQTVVSPPSDTTASGGDMGDDETITCLATSVTVGSPTVDLRLFVEVLRCLRPATVEDSRRFLANMWFDATPSPEHLALMAHLFSVERSLDAINSSADGFPLLPLTGTSEEQLLKRLSMIPIHTVKPDAAETTADAVPPADAPTTVRLKHEAARELVWILLACARPLTPGSTKWMRYDVTGMLDELKIVAAIRDEEFKGLVKALERRLDHASASVTTRVNERILMSRAKAAGRVLACGTTAPAQTLQYFSVAARQEQATNASGESGDGASSLKSSSPRILDESDVLSVFRADEGASAATEAKKKSSTKTADDPESLESQQAEIRLRSARAAGMMGFGDVSRSAYTAALLQLEFEGLPQRDGMHFVDSSVVHRIIDSSVAASTDAALTRALRDIVREGEVVGSRDGRFGSTKTKGVTTKVFADVMLRLARM